MKVTCAILCHNYGRFLSQAIESCLHQEAGPFEIEVLVIDDGSTDETPEICARYAPRIRALRFPQAGFGASLGRGLTEATGEYVCFLDADDYFHPRKIASLLPYLQEGYVFICHNCYWIDEDGRQVDDLEHPGVTSTMCLRRGEALGLLPVLNERFFQALEYGGKSIRPKLPLTCYRKHAGSMQNNPRPGEWHDVLAVVNREFVKRLDELIAQPPGWVFSLDALRRLRAESRVNALFASLEAALERQERQRAFASCLRYVAVSLRHPSCLSSLTIKMVIRTLLGLPVYRCQR